MIHLYLDYFGERILIEVNGHSVYFSNSQYGPIKSTIDNLKLNRNGVLKEFPDLKDDDNWRKIAIDRFKDKIKTYNTEDEIISYIITDLRKYGYKPLLKQKKGFRVEVIK